MTYEEALICLPRKAKLHSKEPEGELYFVRRQAWWIYPDDDNPDSWNCCKKD